VRGGCEMALCMDALRRGVPSVADDSDTKDENLNECIPKPKAQSKKSPWKTNSPEATCSSIILV
jgi:hypothetical protein